VAAPVRSATTWAPRHALDSATSALHQTPLVDAEWREEFMHDLAVLRSKLDILRTLMNGR
jgi:hypothetical protein